MYKKNDLINSEHYTYYIGESFSSLSLLNFSMPTSTFVQDICKKVWREKHSVSEDKSVKDSATRVVNYLTDKNNQINGDSSIDLAKYQKELMIELLSNRVFIPAGRVWSGCTDKKNTTLMNCYVMGQIPDSLSDIFDHLKEAALTMRMGGGIGYNFSTLRPKHSVLHKLGEGALSSGPLSFMDCWDTMCRTIMSAGSRRGAMMAVMNCDHPDIFDFIHAKREKGRFNMFNLSVLVTDRFMRAVDKNEYWALHFKAKPADVRYRENEDEDFFDKKIANLEDVSNSDSNIYEIVSARELWNAIMTSTYNYSDPGVIFIDRLNDFNNLNYCETIYATNPCGEQPLPPYSSCDLGSINLSKLIKNPFRENASLDIGLLIVAVKAGVNLLDLVISCSKYPLEEQKQEVLSKRRIGLGITGLADCMAKLGLVYGSDTSLDFVHDVMSIIARAALLESQYLGEKYGSFPLFDKDQFEYRIVPYVLGGRKFKPDNLRNGTLLSIAPTGSISLAFGENCSSGCEPNFAHKFTRKMLEDDGTHSVHDVYSSLYIDWCNSNSLDYTSDKNYEKFCALKIAITANDIDVYDHIEVQGALQAWVDTSISKTVNVPTEISYGDFKDVYKYAYDKGCKGCTTYRPTLDRESILSTSDESLNENNEEKEIVIQSTNENESVATLSGTNGRKRPYCLDGSTYKIVWPHSPAAMYVTITNHDGKPYEIFISSRYLSNHEWIVALTRMISAHWQSGKDHDFVHEELKQISSQSGGGFVNGKMYPSIVSCLGEIIESHCSGLEIEGFSKSVDYAENVVTIQGDNIDSMYDICPKCHQQSFVHKEGCGVCNFCGYTSC